MTIPPFEISVSDTELAHLIGAVKADAAPCPSQPASDERQLIDRLRRGERCALEQIIAIHQPMIARLVARLSGWRSDTDDLVQDVFVKALSGARRFKGGSRLSTWLTRIAINVCRHHHRTRLLGMKFWKQWMQEAPAINASESAEKREQAERVIVAVRRLKPKYREVVVLHYLEEMEIERVAQVLGLSRGAVEVRLYRGRQMLKEMLQT